MMTLFNPFNELSRFNRVFDDRVHRTNGEHTHWRPAVDIEELDDKIVLTADLPGVSEDEIDLTVHDGVLTLSGKREEVRDETAEARTYSERRFGSFFRKFRLGRFVDSGNIEAAFKNGVLTVTLPKRPELKPKQIKVVTN